MNKLKAGDVIEIQSGHSVYADVPSHFVFTNCRGDFKLVRYNITVGGDFDYLEGVYVVTHTAFDGGGTGHGPGDTYPNGHHVFCLKQDGSDRTIDFYQSGCFSAVIKDIKPICNIKPTYRLPEGMKQESEE